MLTAAVTVRAPVPWRRQLWGVWSMTASETGNEFPLLSNTWVVLSANVKVTVKDEMPVEAGILTAMG